MGQFTFQLLLLRTPCVQRVLVRGVIFRTRPCKELLPYLRA